MIIICDFRGYCNSKK